MTQPAESALADRTSEKELGGEILVEGEDYLVDPDWGHVGIGPKSRVTTQDTVFASYRYSLRRMDTVQVSPEGRASIKQGEPHISSPVPPEPDPGCIAIAHLFVDYLATEVAPDAIYPITETAAQAVTASTPGRIPKTLAKLASGKPVTIVCWGDSVTAGGNASKPELRYVDLFAAGLRERFSQAKIDVQNISAGGANSRQWLYPEKFPYKNLHGLDDIALADASARWEHLWKEGLPYLALLNNTINHPDDRGHRLFAEELWKCFR